MKISTDIVVAGTGPAGLMAALALAGEGFRIVLVGPETNLTDRRTTALMEPQLDFLDRLSILGSLEAGSAPLRIMRIADATSRLFRSPVVTFRASEIGEARFGLNIPNGHLLAELDAAVKGNSNIERVTSLVARWAPQADVVEAALDNGDMIAAMLTVAADGRLSPAREAAGIQVRSRPSRQSAVVLSFSHSRSHEDTSTEFHTETGPFTQVPLQGKRSSLVWVTRPDEAETLMTLDDDTLSRRIEERMQSMLGRVTVEAGHQLYPLASALPHRFAANRVALVGEAAHIFPPIGAQGLNLGIRDIESLAAIAARHGADPGSVKALDAYDRARRPDIVARSSAVQLLNRSLLSDMLPVQVMRSAGLGLLGAASPLRALFMREGLRTGSGLGNLFRG
ncbi:UbiH/UbiF family hydroxylase [Mesorhizobium sp. CAU 1741]|uniref:UbiH/UbiF family hydroxylase n=1 Tax=Mesorhizobium sp. CAU 1741 TaxID=3140366 RepID=UPI00325B738D